MGKIREGFEEEFHKGGPLGTYIGEVVGIKVVFMKGVGHGVRRDTSKELGNVRCNRLEGLKSGTSYWTHLTTSTQST